jgi:hypothetical protein
LLSNLESFQYAAPLDLNMDYYHIELSAQSKELCTVVHPWGNYEHQQWPIGLFNSPDISQKDVNPNG